MSWRSDWPPRALLAGLAALAVVWLVKRTEWVEVETPLPLPDALAQDGSFLARHYLSQLGQPTRKIGDLATLPPAGATLVLTTRHWDLDPRTSERLKRWVEEGGHLVLDAGMLRTRRDRERGWVPLYERAVEEAAPGPASQAQDAPQRPTRRRQDDCRVLKQRYTLEPVFGDTRGFVTCLRGYQSVASALPALWALDGEDGGTEALRVALGRGRVTGISAWLSFNNQRTGESRPLSQGNGNLLNLSNRGLLEGDNAALLAALVDARPGVPVWFLNEVRREALPQWLWVHGAPALALGLAALALALWREALRFGPLAAEPAAARRSLSAQIRGLADFLFARQPAALHAATRRALLEAAEQRLPGWRALKPAAQTRALALACSVAEHRLASALDTVAGRNAAGWIDALGTLESARRSLLTQPARAPAPSTSRTR